MGRGAIIAIFGEPGTEKFELVMTGRHMTLRADGNTGAARGVRRADLLRPRGQRVPPRRRTIPATSFGRRRSPPTASSRCSTASSGKRRLVAKTAEGSRRRLPRTQGGFPGLPVTAMAADQKAELQKVLGKLDRAVPHGGSRRGDGVPRQAGRARRVPPGFLLGRAISATTACGTTGGWKGRRSSGISAARRTSTSGSTWPTTRPCRPTPGIAIRRRSSEGAACPVQDSLPKLGWAAAASCRVCCS